MAAKNSTPSVQVRFGPSLQVRSGAKDALQALQRIKDISQGYHAAGDATSDPVDLLAEYVRSRQESISAFVAAFGDMTPRQHGFIIALAEFIDSGFRDGETDPDGWKPEAAMTAREIDRGRAEMLADMLAN